MNYIHLRFSDQGERIGSQTEPGKDFIQPYLPFFFFGIVFTMCSQFLIINISKVVLIMKVPIPSFRQIRSFMVVFLILYFFFMIEFVKSSFATSLVRSVGYIISQTDFGTVYTPIHDTLIIKPGLNPLRPVVFSGTAQPPVNIIYVSALIYYQLRNDYTGTCFWSQSVPGGYSMATVPDWNTKPDITSTKCPCDKEREIIIAECGGEDNVDWPTWNYDTCTGGKCKEINNLQFGPPPETCSP